MSGLTLDGSTRYIGTEFVKLLNTGTSNLATEEYVETAIINGGGGGGGEGVNLSNYYNKSETDTLLNNKYNKSETDTLLNNKYNKSETDTLLNNKYDKAETDTLLNNKYSKSETDTLLNNKYDKSETNTLLDAKLNINNPQDMAGTLRIGHILGTSKIILNAVSSDKDFYVNGDAQIGGNHLVASLDSSGYIKGSNIQTNTFNALNTNDILFKSNNDTYLQYDVSESKIASSKLIQCGGNLKTQEINTIAPLDMVIKRNDVSMIELQDNLTVLNTKTQCENNIVCDNYESKNASTIINHIMNESTGEIKFYVGSPVNPDATTNLVMTLQNSLITFHKPTSPEIGAGGGVDDSNLVKYTGETLQTIEGDLVLGGGSQFGSFDVTFNGTAYFSQSIELNLGVNINLGSNKGYIRSINLGGGNHAYDYANFSSGGFHRFYVGGSPFPQFLRFQLSSTQAYFNVNAVCNTELQTDIINTKNAGDSDLIFKRNDIEYMKFEGTQQAVEITKGAKSNTYDSIGNADVSFRRNTIDFMYLRNGTVEVNSGINLLAESGKFDTIDSATATDVVFKRGGVNFFSLNGSQNIIDVSTGRALSSQYLYCDNLFNRNNGADMVFQGSNTTDNGRVEYMRYKKADEVVNFSKDIHLNQGQKMYFHKATNDDVYIGSVLENGSNMLEFVNRDSIGQIRFRLWDGSAFATTLSMSWNNINIQRNTTVSAGYSITGELVDTSDFTKKYDIKSIERNMTDIVKAIEPKTFKMKDEKDIGITKNHLGFIADEIMGVIPSEWENIVLENDEGIKQLNYVKMNAILWGCVKEQQTKIEHLEASVYELQEAMKELLKAKPKPKPKKKSKDKNSDAED